MTSGPVSSQKTWGHFAGPIALCPASGTAAYPYAGAYIMNAGLGMQYVSGVLNAIGQSALTGVTAIVVGINGEVWATFGILPNSGAVSANPYGLQWGPPGDHTPFTRIYAGGNAGADGNMPSY